MNKTSRAILLGMLLGDGCLKTKHHKNSTYYEFVICHSQKQEDYLDHKLKVFHSLMGGKVPNKSYENIKNKYFSVRFSRCDKVFSVLHKYLYSKNNKKFFTQRVLSYLNEQSIAFWYMDDGCLTINPSKKSFEMRLYTYFSEEEADNCLEYFINTWGISPKKRKYNKTGQFNLVFNTTESRKFEDLIGKYIIPSMEYKLPSKSIPRVLGPTDIVGDDIV